jgi:hypothetical protein
MPAVLGLIGGVMVYILGTNGLRAQILVSLLVISLSAGMIGGINWGATFRLSAEEYQGVRDADRDYKGALRRLANEREFLSLKKALEKKYDLQLSTSYSRPAAGDKKDKAAKSPTN